MGYQRIEDTTFSGADKIPEGDRYIDNESFRIILPEAPHFDGESDKDIVDVPVSRE